MDKANAVTVEDRARKRQAYLLAKSGAIVRLVVVMTLVATSLGMSARLIAGSLDKIWNLDRGSAWVMILLCTPLPLVIALIGASRIRARIKAVSVIDYVPAVTERSMTGSANEVLLRGSDAPAATQEELLRAAHSEPLQSVEELLLPSEAEKE